jgi:FtsP/CotA-like multicopper oxidase with cupredoxin domain
LPARKETADMPKNGGLARFVVQYADYPGEWRFHRHILDHEHHGMMGSLEVR